MILSKKDYEFYLLADKYALEVNRKRPKIYGDEIWKFQRLLRKLEYFVNCKKSIFYKPYIIYTAYRFNNLSHKLGFSIPINVFGAGLSISHIGTIVVNGNAKVGKNCRIHVCTNIGIAAGDGDAAPTLGDNIYIGPGAKIFGKIQIADNIAIGANAVVNKSFLNSGVTIGGIPAKEISKKGSYGLNNNGTDGAEKILHI